MVIFISFQRRYSNYYIFSVQYLYLSWQHVFTLLTGDEEEWDQQCAWHSELVSGLDKVDVCIEQLQQDQEKLTTQGGAWATTLQAMVRLAF